MAEIIKLENLSIGYRKGSVAKAICSPINLSLFEGEFVCMLGPNGSGKTTLLKTLCGVQKALRGDVTIYSKSIANYNPAELPTILSVVLTEKISVGNLKVSQLVSLGRYPYTNWLGNLAEKDERIINRALEETHTLKFASRNVGELSDGEFQKVMIARALAQDTPIILLDEPTAHLDLPNRVEIFRLLRRLASETKKIILLSTHELDLSIQSADKIWLINPNSQLGSAKATEKVINIQLEGHQIFSGAPEDLIIDGSFERAFQAQGLTFDKMTGRFSVNTDLTIPVNLAGENYLRYWTERALERIGCFNNPDSSEIKITVDSDKQQWNLLVRGKHFSVKRIEELLMLIKNEKR